MAWKRPFSVPAMAPAARLLSRRCSKGSSIAKMTAVFGLLTKPLIEMPGKATTLSTPGWPSAIFVTSRVTASVRSSEAPGGS